MSRIKHKGQGRTSEKRLAKLFLNKQVVIKTIGGEKVIASGLCNDVEDNVLFVNGVPILVKNVRISVIVSPIIEEVEKNKKDLIL